MPRSGHATGFDDGDAWGVGLERFRKGLEGLEGFRGFRILIVNKLQIRLLSKPICVDYKRRNYWFLKHQSG